MKIEIAAWEDDEFIILINGKPTGMTLHQRDALIVKRWLESGLPEFMKNITTAGGDSK